MVDCLVNKVETQGDMNLIQKEKTETPSENKRLKKEMGNLQNMINQKDGEIESMRSLYKEMEEKYVQTEKMREREKRLWGTETSGQEEKDDTREIL